MVIRLCDVRNCRVVKVCVCSQGLLIERTGRRVILWGGYGVMSTGLVMVTVTLHLKVGFGVGRLGENARKNRKQPLTVQLCHAAFSGLGS